MMEEKIKEFRTPNNFVYQNRPISNFPDPKKNQRENFFRVTKHPSTSKTHERIFSAIS